MNSCAYECKVMHHRLAPRRNQFRYRIFMLALDLDELPALARSNPLFSHNRFNCYTFHDRDHLTLPGLEKASVKENLVAWLHQQGLEFPRDGRITIVTLPRIFGYIFNPVSFYFCFDGAGDPLCAVAQVGNTFKEMKPYLLRDRDASGRFRLVAPKHFYVSPFSDLEVEFDFKLRLPTDQLEIHVDDRRGSETLLLSTLAGQRTPLTPRTLAWFLVKYPFLTLQVIALIHWHALLLWLKRVPWFHKTADLDLQREVFNPHPSLAGKPK
ncbi:MAG: DUF1365 domain-containing protein [Chthoniobacteraceae bacterium]